MFNFYAYSLFFQHPKINNKIKGTYVKYPNSGLSSLINYLV